jgi:hypothetical protein
MYPFYQLAANMIEVFKTNVQKESQADLLIDLISLAFTDYRASFDLEDCDKVLRVASRQPEICSTSVIRLLEDFGYHAEVMNEGIEERIADLVPHSSAFSFSTNTNNQHNHLLQ